MSYTFRIHKGTPAQEDGWQPSDELVGGSDSKAGLGSIDDSIVGGNAGKVGTSIPTPFARVYLFETAFSFVALNKRSKEYNFYDQLVTQSLDLLQLIFEKGKDPKLKIYEWNGPIQINELVKSGFKEGHRSLANSFNMSIKANPYLKTINLIEYDGVVLGGTSPFTLTYTSPNAIRQLMEKNIELCANDKSQLLKERSIKHLRERSREFQRYVYWLVMKNNIADFTKDGTPLSSFYNYVKSQNIDITEEELSEVRESYFEKVRMRSDISSADVTLTVFGDLALRVNAEPINMKESDFYMRPSVRCFGDGQIPIILPTDGDSSYDGWQYTKNESWQSFTTVDYWTIIDKKIEDRCLPTNGAQNKETTNKYPWLTTGDFFESSMVNLGYNLNINRFYFPNTGRITPQFLLPIRREYFKYFTLDDLKDNLKCEIKKDSRDETKIIEIAFELKLKLQNKENIVLRRAYTASRPGQKPDFPILDMSDGMSFGVFPFFRCDDEYDSRNEYAVYLYGSSSDPDSTKLGFYKQDFEQGLLTSILDSDTDGRGEGLIRTKTSDTGFSKIYNLRNQTSNSFDLIEVNLNDKKNICRGLAIPLWIKLPVVDSNKESIISIDFGTSNTYVSYLENGTAKPLTIGTEDQQMVLLNGNSFKHGTRKAQYRAQENFGDATYMNQYLREFVPSIVGHRDEVVDDEFIEYPIKTATIEKQNFKAEDSLFSGISIGFNIDNEKNDVESERFRYVTNLKWSAEEHKGKQDLDNNLAEFNKDKSRIQAFCDQTLWMIKNKLIMKGYASNVKMMYFYPDSMSEVGREIFKESWENSVKSILANRGFDVTLKEELEAISPYYSLLILNGNKIYNKSTANIDVGGGTTDYFILDQSHMKLDNDGAESGKAYEASIFFAGNDLWGATYPESTNHGKYQYNGFVEYMKSKVQDCPEQAKTLYNCYDKDKGMSDFSGFFFKNDELFGFSDKISSHEKFRFIVFLHYAAIIYHFADILKMIKKGDPEFKYPEVLTFTGKGSEYVQMISKQSGPISEITTQLIRAFGLEDFKTIEVIRVANPKALTADGGIYEMMSNSALRINLFDNDEFGAHKSETITNTPYERIGKLCLGLESGGTEYRRADVLNVKKDAMEHVRKFADTVYKHSLLERTRSFLKINLTEDDYNLFMKCAEDSYDTHASRFLKNNIATAGRPLEESVFFFAMKNTLINLSKYYYDKK